MSAGIEQVTDMRVFEDCLDATVHVYPSDPRYRRSGAVHPQPGDVALCGHVKATPWGGGKWKDARLTCGGCRMLRGLSEVGDNA